MTRELTRDELERALAAAGLTIDDVERALSMPNRRASGSNVVSLPPRKHHLDKRVDRLVEAGEGEDPDALLSTPAVAGWLNVSPEWLEIGRSRNYGPAYIRLSPRRVRYRCGDVLLWLEGRKFYSTAAYAKGGDIA